MKKSVKRALGGGLVEAFLTLNFIKSLQGGLEGSQGHPGRLLGALGDILGHPERLLGALGDVLGRQGGAPEGVRTTKGGLGKGLGPSQKCKKHVFLGSWRPDACISKVF